MAPFGIYGFIPGLTVGLFLIIIVSRLTKRPPEEHLRKIWKD